MEKNTLTDEQLIQKARILIHDLCKTGGRSFTMSVPPDNKEDDDLIFSELYDRFESHHNNSISTLTLNEKDIEKLVSESWEKANEFFRDQGGINSYSFTLGFKSGYLRALKKSNEKVELTK